MLNESASIQENREYFLKHLWLKYPSFDSQFKHYGRVQEVTSSHLSLNSNIWNLATDFEWADGVHLSPSKILLPDDLIGIKLNEKSEISKIILYAPCLRSLEDSASKPQQFTKFINQVKDFFCQIHFDEVLTPTLVETPGSEPSIEFFELQLKILGQEQKKYLPSSPEISLKKVLCKTLKSSFEIRPCFRNNESTPHHSPEFFMLEWYRVFSNLDQIEQDVIQLINHLCQFFQNPVPRFKSVTIQELFLKNLDYELSPTANEKDYLKLCHSLGLKTSADDQIDDLFFRIWLEKIEPTFNPEEVLFVKNYPAFQAAYSKIDPLTGWAQRLEVFWKGFELANGFHEVNDPFLQKQRMTEDNRKRIQKGFSAVPIDPEFIQALEGGMPPTSGIALGIDRLAMIFLATENIQQLRY